MRTIALVIFFALSSKLPEHPTQNKISGTSPLASISAIVGIFKGSVLMYSPFIFQIPEWLHSLQPNQQIYLRNVLLVQYGYQSNDNFLLWVCPLIMRDS